MAIIIFPIIEALLARRIKLDLKSSIHGRVRLLVVAVVSVSTSTHTHKPHIITNIYIHACIHINLIKKCNFFALYHPLVRNYY